MKLRNMTRCALCAGLLCLGAWLAVPLGGMTFTLQTLALFLLLQLLGGKWGTLACVLYLLLGAVGLPVFSGFRGGLGMFTGTTGGYLLGFPGAALVYWAWTARFPRQRLLAMVLGQLVCYGMGTAWLWILYGREGVLPALLQGVVPYLLPDALKLVLAWELGKRITLPSGT